MRIISLFLLSAATTISLFSQTAQIQEMVNATRRDSLLSYVQKLQSFGTRYEYTAMQDSAASSMLRTFSQWGLQASAVEYSPFGYDFMDVAVVSKDSIWVVGDLILFSSNGGSSWSSQDKAIEGFFYGVDFVTSRLGVAVDQFGRIIRTTNAGSTWIPVTSPTTSQLLSVSFADVSTGIIVGDVGTILRSTTGGASWSVVSSGTTQTLRDAKFVTANIAISVGNQGSILKSVDGGLTWQKKPSGVTAYLRSVHFINTQNGFASGDSSTVVKTTDGGETWSRLPFTNLAAGVLRGVLFADSQNGLLMEQSGKIFITSNGGQSWQVTNNTANTSFYKLRGIPGQRLLVVGSSSTVYTSTNMGSTWTSFSAISQDYKHISRNIVVTIPGTVTPNQECVMAAHYDSYSNGNAYIAAPGADDNATGTAAVMEAARVMSNYRFKSTVKLVAVSAEEFGLLGSKSFVATEKNEGRTIIGGVTGDMLGWPTNGDTLKLGVISYLSRNRLADSAIVLNQRYKIGLNLGHVNGTGNSDFASFARAGYDAVGFADAGYTFYHTVSDSASKLHFGLVHRATQLMIASVAELAGVVGRATPVAHLPTVPTLFSLEQNYPNPFNPSTTIPYSLPMRSAVRLRIFNSLGQIIADLVDTEQPAGWNQIVWNANVSSGLYFSRLEAVSLSDPTKRFIDVKKMLLVR